MGSGALRGSWAGWRRAALAGLGLGLLGASSGCRPGPSADTVSGTIEAEAVHVASRTGGRVVSVRAREGDLLAAGQVIVELAAPELLAQREQLAAQLAEWEAGPRPQEIAVARAEAEAVAAALELARREARRAHELQATRVNTAAEAERADAQVRTLERQLEAARQRHEVLRLGTRPERLAMARAQVAELDARLAELRVVAPTNAVLETLAVRVGDVVPAHREVAALVLDTAFWVRVYVPQTWLGGIRVGNPVPLRADALPGREFTGTIEQVHRQAEFTPRNVQTPDDRIRQVYGVKLRVDPASGLRPGMTVDARFAAAAPVARDGGR